LIFDLIVLNQVIEPTLPDPGSRWLKMSRGRLRPGGKKIRAGLSEWRRSSKDAVSERPLGQLAIPYHLHHYKQASFGTDR